MSNLLLNFSSTKSADIGSEVFILNVITITFNNFEELTNTLHSLEKVPDIESIVINGGKCSRTIEYLKTFKGISFSEKDQGISDAFNKGFRASSKKYVVYLNSGDVLIDADYYPEAIQFLESNPDYDFVYADLAFEDQYAGTIRVKSGNPLPSMPFMHPTLIVRKSIMKKIGLFKLEHQIAMDLDFAYRLLKNGSKGHYIERMVVRMDGKGISSTQYIDGFVEVIKIIFANKDFSINSLKFISSKFITMIMKLGLLKLGGGKILGLYRKFRYGFKNV